LQLEGREQQDAALDRRELIQLAIEHGRDQALERLGVPIVPRRSRAKYSASALRSL